MDVCGRTAVSRGETRNRFAVGDRHHYRTDHAQSSGETRVRRRIDGRAGRHYVVHDDDSSPNRRSTRADVQKSSPSFCSVSAALSTHVIHHQTFRDGQFSRPRDGVGETKSAGQESDA